MRGLNKQKGDRIYLCWTNTFIFWSGNKDKIRLFKSRLPSYHTGRKVVGLWRWIDRKAHLQTAFSLDLPFLLHAD